MTQVTVSLTFANSALAATALAAVAALDGSATGVAPGKPVPTAAPAASTPTAAPAPAKTPAAAPVPKEAASPSPAPAPADAPAVTYEKSGIPELLQVYAKKDQPAAVALLAKYGAKKGSGLKPEDFAAFKVDVEAALAPPAPPAEGGDLAG